MSVIRSWACLNSRCSRAFDSWEANPACPHCGCVRVNWLPAGGHIKGSATKTADAELRHLADVFKMGDMKSARAGESAKIVQAQPVTDPGARPIQFAPGFSAVAHPSHAVCVPSSGGVVCKTSAPIGKAVAPNASFPRVAGNTVVEARHSGKAL